MVPPSPQAFNGRSSGAVNGTAAYRSQPGRGYNPGLVSNGTYPGPGHTTHLSLGNTRQIYDMMISSHENPSVARVQQQHNVFRAAHPAFLFGPNSSQGGCCSTQRRFAEVGSNAIYPECRVRTHPRTALPTIISSPKVSACPYLRFCAISSLCPIVYGLARPVRARAPPRANATWRVVQPPRSMVHSAKRPLAPSGLRLRVWAGVGQSLLRRSSDVDISVAFRREKTSFLLRSQPLRKIRVASLGKVSTSCLRLKIDVERPLPFKKEYVLYVPLSARQREVYDAVVKGSLHRLLAGA